MLQRRSLLAGLGSLLAAPVIIRTPGLLMPIKAPKIVTASLTVPPQPSISSAAEIAAFLRESFGQSMGHPVLPATLEWEFCDVWAQEMQRSLIARHQNLYGQAIVHVDS